MAITVNRRAGGYTDRLRKYGVHLDGAEVGKLGAGETLTFDAQPGSHEVKLKIDWAESPPLRVEVEREDEDIRLFCEPAAKPWAVLYWMTFGRKRYIKLRRV